MTDDIDIVNVHNRYEWLFINGFAISLSVLLIMIVSSFFKVDSDKGIGLYLYALMNIASFTWYYFAIDLRYFKFGRACVMGTNELLIQALQEDDTIPIDDDDNFWKQWGA